jgi:hypothetical protein
MTAKLYREHTFFRATKSAKANTAGNNTVGVFKENRKDKLFWSSLKCESSKCRPLTFRYMDILGQF